MTIDNETEKNLLHIGAYRAKPIEGALTRSGNGKDQYAAVFLLQEGPDTGKRITWWGGFEGDGFGYTTDAMKSMGWDGAQHPAEFKPTKEVIVVIEHHTPAQGKKAGQTVARVKYVNSLDGQGRKGPNLASMKLNEVDERAAGDAILERMRAQSGDAPAPKEFTPKVDNDKLPF